MGLFRKELIVKNLSIGDRLINFFSVALKIVDIATSNEKEIIIKTRTTGQKIPEKIVFPKNRSGEIVLVGYRKHIPLCQSQKKTDYFKKIWDKI